MRNGSARDKGIDFDGQFLLSSLAAEFMLYNAIPSGEMGTVRESLRLGGACVGSRRSLERRQVWPNIAARRLVAFSDGGLSRLRRVSGLCQLGGVPEHPLHLRTLYLAVLFAGAFRQFSARFVWPEAELVPELSALSLRRCLILWIPGLFRVTCYYYRGAYYKSFWADPPACAVSEPRKSLSRRAKLSAYSAEFSSLLSQALVHCLGLSGLRRSERRSFSRMDSGSGLEASCWS